MTPAAPWQAAAVALLGGDPSGARWANLGGTPLNATWRLDVGLDRFFVKTNTAALSAPKNSRMISDRPDPSSPAKPITSPRQSVMSKGFT